MREGLRAHQQQQQPDDRLSNTHRRRASGLKSLGIHEQQGVLRWLSVCGLPDPDALGLRLPGVPDAKSRRAWHCHIVITWHHLVMRDVRSEWYFVVGMLWMPYGGHRRQCNAPSMIWFSVNDLPVR